MGSFPNLDNIIHEHHCVEAAVRDVSHLTSIVVTVDKFERIDKIPHSQTVAFDRPRFEEAFRQNRTTTRAVSIRLPTPDGRALQWPRSRPGREKDSRREKESRTRF
ncbi:hypothetical protein Pla52n_64550 [Stieleria varia]|uniref:Uncharacterized protein n=1 Tax=Stieleria varia TaxID=2528005 RepID=A0A5C5ZWI9_9BACT|nr:hypothetical protein Pla52n_64550 [Stieleria varia]